LISKWDRDLSIEILGSWYSLIDENGWIGREQILGAEARSRVPERFIPQNPNYANPPMLLMPLVEIVRQLEYEKFNDDNADQFFEDPTGNYDITRLQIEFIYERAKKHYEWYKSTQKGRINTKLWNDNPPAGVKIKELKGDEIYKWQGREQDYTLTSGLDDYPRASEPSDWELHVDLQSWMVFGGKESPIG
jgi:mannosyl-oligosaccharide glucosidase